MLFTGDRISGQRAYQLGLVNEVVPLSELMPAATRMAERICENSPIAVKTIKEIAMRSLDMPVNYPPAAWELYDSGIMAQVRSSRDHVEGHQAFLEKRRADFRGE
jgi:enoyl-CoA hydratase/carnithine racemase